MFNDNEVQFIKEKAIEAGKKSLDTERYKSEFVLEGGKKGFEMCRTLNTKEDFYKAMDNLRQEQIEMWKEENLDKEEYWHHRYKQLQVEWMFEIMKYVWGGFESYSARAGIAISRIFKENGIDEYKLGYYRKQ